MSGAKIGFGNRHPSFDDAACRSPRLLRARGRRFIPVSLRPAASLERCGAREHPEAARRLDLGLESNLRTFFEQDYPAFEILFAAREESDPGIAVARKLATEYSQVRTRFIITGEPPYPNAKVYSIDKMMAAAAHDLLVMSDSDIRVTPSMLKTVAAEFQDPKLGVATCPYRAVAGPSFWSRIEAIGMNTDFWSGALVARMLEGMRFAVGPTIVALSCRHRVHRRLRQGQRLSRRRALCSVSSQPRQGTASFSRPT